MKYIWQHPEWPNFTWDDKAVAKNAYVVEASRLVGEVQHLDAVDKTATIVDLMVAEAVTTSQIEGENFDREDVRSSIRNQLGLNQSPEAVKNHKANGIASLMISIWNNFEEPLTAERLCSWQDMLIVDLHQRAINDVGMWRTSPEPMQIVSGYHGREKIHYEAPPSIDVPKEMTQFIKWFNSSRDMNGVVRAGISHLYFECIHPFSDGNGRVGRAIAEVALSQELKHPALLSLSTAIEANRQAYYDALSRASCGGLDITEWLYWFSDLLMEAQLLAKKQVKCVLAKAKFWDNYSEQLNARQTKVIQRMLREGVSGFEGGMSAKKYGSITGCSKATATRDLVHLLQLGAVKKLDGSGRSTRYDIQLPL